MPKKINWKRIPKDQRTQVTPEAKQPKNIKVRINMYVDADVLEYFKSRAATTKAPYQSIINSELRQIMEANQADDPESITQKLKQARTVIDSAIRVFTGGSK